MQELREIAAADGWEPHSLAKEIVVHKRRLKYINEAETKTIR